MLALKNWDVDPITTYRRYLRDPRHPPEKPYFHGRAVSTPQAMQRQLGEKFPAYSLLVKVFSGCVPAQCAETTFDIFDKINPSFLSETLGLNGIFFDTASSSAKLTKPGESPQKKTKHSQLLSHNQSRSQNTISQKLRCKLFMTKILLMVQKSSQPPVIHETL